MQSKLFLCPVSDEVCTKAGYFNTAYDLLKAYTSELIAIIGKVNSQSVPPKNKTIRTKPKT